MNNKVSNNRFITSIFKIEIKSKIVSRYSQNHDWNSFFILLRPTHLFNIINRRFTIYSTQWCIERWIVECNDSAWEKKRKRGREDIHGRSKLWMATPLMEWKEDTGGEVQEGQLINGAATDHFPWLYTFSPSFLASLSCLPLLPFWLVFPFSPLSFFFSILDFRVPLLLMFRFELVRLAAIDFEGNYIHCGQWIESS